MQRLVLIPAAVWVWAILVASPAQAYLDPGAGSILIQALLGGTAGAALVLKLYWQTFVSYFRRRRPQTPLDQPVDRS